MSPFEIEAAGASEAATLDDIEPVPVDEESDDVQDRTNGYTEGGGECEISDGTKARLAVPRMRQPLMPIHREMTDARESVFGIIGTRGANHNRLDVLETSDHYECLFTGNVDGVRVNAFGYKPTPYASEFVGKLKVVLTLGSDSVEHDIEELGHLKPMPDALSKGVKNALLPAHRNWTKRRFRDKDRF